MKVDIVLIPGHQESIHYAVQIKIRKLEYALKTKAVIVQRNKRMDQLNYMKLKEREEERKISIEIGLECKSTHDFSYFSHNMRLVIQLIHYRHKQH